VHAANRTPLRLNDTVAIVGAGAVGLVSMQAIRLKGAGRIIVTDLSEARLALARDLGADATVQADGPDLVGRLRAETGPDGADAVIEAVGVQATIDTPNSHHGILRPPKKNDAASRPAVRDTIRPIKITIARENLIINQIIGYI